MGQLDRAARTREFAGQACNMAVEGSEASICPSVLGSVLSAGVGLPPGGGKAVRRSEFGKLAPAVLGETDFESYTLSSAVSCARGGGAGATHPPLGSLIMGCFWIWRAILVGVNSGIKSCRDVGVV